VERGLPEELGAADVKRVAVDAALRPRELGFVRSQVSAALSSRIVEESRIGRTR
jgi:hypothetical protein